MKKILIVSLGFLVIAVGAFVVAISLPKSPETIAKAPLVSTKPGAEGDSLYRGSTADANSSASDPMRDIAASVARSPKSQQGLDEFQRRSDARWAVRRNRAGFVAKLSEGSFSLGNRAPVVGGERFLKEFASSLLGVDKSVLQLEKNLQEEHGAQLVYEQEVQGMPVFGSRLSLFVDREGNLVHLSSELFQGEVPNKGGLISAAESAKIVRGALIDRLENEYGMIDPAAYPLAEFESMGVLGLRLQRGNVTFIYRYELTLQGDHHGSYEAMVDAVEGQLVLFRDLNRK
jgi:hypothetical protein